MKNFNRILAGHINRIAGKELISIPENANEADIDGILSEVDPLSNETEVSLTEEVQTAISTAVNAAVSTAVSAAVAKLVSKDGIDESISSAITTAVTASVEKLDFASNDSVEGLVARLDKLENKGKIESIEKEIEVDTEIVDESDIDEKDKEKKVKASVSNLFPKSSITIG